jgi:hypothetical protein
MTKVTLKFKGGALNAATNKPRYGFVFMNSWPNSSINLKT